MARVPGSHAEIEMEMAQARREGNTQYGPYANAEELIRAHIASIDPAVRSAGLKRTNEELTATLDLSQIEVPEGGKLLDAAVHGTDPKDLAIVFVWEDQKDGRAYKGVQAYSSDYELPSESETDRASREHAITGFPERSEEEQSPELKAALAEVEKLKSQLATAKAKKPAAKKRTTAAAKKPAAAKTKATARKS